MKAYKVETTHLSGIHGICCHDTVAKARAFCASELSEVYTVPYGKALISLTVRRAPDFDEWAAAQPIPRHVDPQYAKVPT